MVSILLNLKGFLEWNGLKQKVLFSSDGLRVDLGKTSYSLEKYHGSELHHSYYTKTSNYLEKKNDVSDSAYPLSGTAQKKYLVSPKIIFCSSDNIMLKHSTISVIPLQVYFW